MWVHVICIYIYMDDIYGVKARSHSFLTPPGSRLCALLRVARRWVSPAGRRRKRGSGGTALGPSSLSLCRMLFQISGPRLSSCPDLEAYSVGYYISSFVDHFLRGCISGLT